jgi:hypothetical protein
MCCVLLCMLDAVEGGMYLPGGVGGARGNVLCATLFGGWAQFRYRNFHCGGFLVTVHHPDFLLVLRLEGPVDIPNAIHFVRSQVPCTFHSRLIPHPLYQTQPAESERKKKPAKRRRSRSRRVMRNPLRRAVIAQRTYHDVINSSLLIGTESCT